MILWQWTMMILERILHADNEINAVGGSTPVFLFGSSINRMADGCMQSPAIVIIVFNTIESWDAYSFNSLVSRRYAFPIHSYWIMCARVCVCVMAFFLFRNFARRLYFKVIWKGDEKRSTHNGISCASTNKAIKINKNNLSHQSSSRHRACACASTHTHSKWK